MFVLNQVDRRKGRYIDEEELERWVIGTRRAQGLPDRIEDPVVLARIVELLWSR